MPVHETKGGYKYGETGKTYKNKKDAIKQAIAIAYSKAEKKGRKPSQEEIKTEIKGNPEEKMNKTASALQKEASVRKQAADLKGWLTAARNFLNTDAAKRIAIGLGAGGGAYLLSGLADKDNKYWKERLGGGLLFGGLAGWKGLDAYRAAKLARLLRRGGVKSNGEYHASLPGTEVPEQGVDMGVQRPDQVADEQAQQAAYYLQHQLPKIAPSDKHALPTGDDMNTPQLKPLEIPAKKTPEKPGHAWSRFLVDTTLKSFPLSAPYAWLLKDELK